MKKIVFSLVLVGSIHPMISSAKKNGVWPLQTEPSPLIRLDLSDDKIREFERLTPEERKTVIEINLSNSNLTTVPDILRLAPNLQFLHLNNNPLVSLEGLQGLENLWELFLNDTTLRSLETMPQLPYVYLLVLQNNTITSLQGIQKLTGLKHLFLNHNPQLPAESVAEYRDRNQTVIIHQKN